jgi:hypothetical protein
MRMKWEGHVPHTGETRNEYKILVMKSGRKRLLRTTRHRWEERIKMDLLETACGLNSSSSGYVLVADPCGYDRESMGSIKGGIIASLLERTISF